MKNFIITLLFATIGSAIGFYFAMFFDTFYLDSNLFIITPLFALIGSYIGILISRFFKTVKPETNSTKEWTKQKTVLLIIIILLISLVTYNFYQLSS